MWGYERTPPPQLNQDSVHTQGDMRHALLAGAYYDPTLLWLSLTRARGDLRWTAEGRTGIPIVGTGNLFQFLTCCRGSWAALIGHAEIRGRNLALRLGNHPTKAVGFARPSAMPHCPTLTPTGYSGSGRWSRADESYDLVWPLAWPTLRSDQARGRFAVQ